MLLLVVVTLLGASLTAAESSAPSPCVLRIKDGWREPATLDALLSCQAKARETWIRRYRDQKRAEPPAGALDALDDAQRAEARAYAARHPDRATVTTASDDALAKQQERTSAAMGKNDEKVDPGTASDLDALNAVLVGNSKRGAAGITPDSARAIAEFLRRRQGSMSPDMQALIDHLSHDGGKLSDKSMVELKQAARAAKDGGLELGVDDKLESWLLDPTTDPKEPAPGAL